MTETFAVTMFTPDDPPEKGASAGKPRGYADLAIIDDEDGPLPAGEVGEIVVRPREPGIIMLGYYKMPEATVRESRNLWFHTGDRGYLDEDGYLYFVDRKKEAIRRRGENISAYEVEMLVARHPQVLEVAAVPVASEMSEDEVMVYVVPRPGERRQRGRAAALLPTATWRISWCRASSISSRRCPRPPARRSRNTSSRPGPSKTAAHALGPRGGRVEARAVTSIKQREKNRGDNMQAN